MSKYIDSVKQYLKSNPSVRVSVQYAPYMNMFEVRLDNYDSDKHVSIGFPIDDNISCSEMLDIACGENEKEFMKGQE